MEKGQIESNEIVVGKVKSMGFYKENLTFFMKY